jgi:hypothetical protein
MPPGALEFGTECLKTFRLIYGDIPQELRKESWERWFRFWEPFWKLCGLEIPKEVPK